MPVIRIIRRLLVPLCRAIYWTPLLASGAVTPTLAVLITAGTGGITPADAIIVLRASALLVGAAAGFALADDMAVSTAALPSPRWLRQWLRTVLALGPSAIGWMATYAVTATSSADGTTAPLASAALEAVVLVAVGLAGAAFAVRRIPGRHGAVAGTATLLGALVGSLFLAGDWSPWPLPGDARWNTAHTGWLLALPITVAALTVAHRDTR